MTILVREVTVYRCERCGHEWIPRGALEEANAGKALEGNPTVCPKCKSPYWNKPREKKGSRKSKKMP